MFFLGGCTYTEIAALRWVGRQNKGTVCVLRIREIWIDARRSEILDRHHWHSKRYEPDRERSPRGKKRAWKVTDAVVGSYLRCFESRCNILIHLVLLGAVSSRSGTDPCRIRERERPFDGTLGTTVPV